MTALLDAIFKEALGSRLANYEYRPAQLVMARAVAQALDAGTHAVIEAPTGTGKSLAYLIPALLYADKTGQRIILSTATINLQEQLMNKDIPLAAGVLDLSVPALLFKGRSNYLCRMRFEDERAAQQLAPEKGFQEVERWLGTTRSGDRAELETLQNSLWARICSEQESCLENHCHFRDNCFLTVRNKMADQAGVIVTNHHLFFTDLKLRIESAGTASVLPGYDAVIFDEAHHLGETATHAFETTFSRYRVPRLISRIGKIAGHSISRELDALQTANSQFFMGFNSNERDKWELTGDIGADRLIDRLKATITALKVLEERDDIDVYKLHRVIRTASNQVNELIAIAAPQDRGYLSWAEKTDRDFVLHATPIDIAAYLKKGLFDVVQTCVLTSATLSCAGSTDYFRRQVGLAGQDMIKDLILDTPFSYEEQVGVFLPRQIPEPGAENYLAATIPVIREVISLAKGRTLVLCTSYRSLDKIYNELSGSLPYNILRQGDKPRHVLLREFSSDVNSVLIGTSSFWEGIDVPGESLSCLIIEKLPFSHPEDPVHKARTEAVKRAGGRPFVHLTLPEAVLRFKQGFGRLIRQESDRGVVVVLDRRIITKAYGRAFRASIPRCRELSQISQIGDFLTG